MKDTDFLFETSSKYRVLLNRINDNIAQESDYINSKEFHSLLEKSTCIAGRDL